ncbi:MAG: YfiR family protein, partial [Opitutaceae bacterium]
VNGRPLVVKLVTTAEEISTVHLLFLPAGEETRVPAGAWKDVAIVAVGESPASTALGATITFVQVGDKVRFEVNLATAESGGVKISAQLLKLATAVRRSPGGKP